MTITQSIRCSPEGGFLGYGKGEMMNLTEVSYKVDKIVESLSFSFEKEAVENVFSDNEIEDKAERIKLLRKCMNVIGTSNISEILSTEDEYNDELEIFAEGSWRLLV